MKGFCFPARSITLERDTTHELKDGCILDAFEIENVGNPNNIT